MKTQTKAKPEIQSAVVFRCTNKITGEIFYAVPSDDASVEQPYKVTFNEVTRRYEDTCLATCDCKHCRAVREVVKAKAEIAKQQGKVPAAPSHEGEGQLPQGTRQALMNWHQREHADQIEAEYNATRSWNYNSLNYPSGAYRPLDR